MVRPIIACDSPVLRQTAAEAELTGDRIAGLIADLKDTMRQSNACSLSAPQINSSLRIFVIDTDQALHAIKKTDNADFFADDLGARDTFINPVIIDYSWDNTWTWEEDCLNFPGTSMPVSRPWRIIIMYFDEELKMRVDSFAGLTARLIQQACDQLDGILCRVICSHWEKNFLR
jgi:peptide deformylase